MKPKNCLEACVEGGLHSMFCPNVSTKAPESQMTEKVTVLRILRTEEPAWKTLHEVIDASCQRENLNQDEAALVWELGLAAYKAARYWGMETWRGTEERIRRAKQG